MSTNILRFTETRTNHLRNIFKALILWLNTTRLFEVCLNSPINVLALLSYLNKIVFKIAFFASFDFFKLSFLIIKLHFLESTSLLAHFEESSLILIMIQRGSVML